MNTAMNIIYAARIDSKIRIENSGNYMAGLNKRNADSSWKVQMEGIRRGKNKTGAHHKIMGGSLFMLEIVFFYPGKTFFA